MKKILVPTDFTFNAINALEYAIRLARVMDAEVTILHVVEPEMAVMDVPVPSGVGTLQRMEAAETAIRAQLDYEKNLVLDRDTERVPIDSKIKIGNPTQQIARLAAAKDIDLIVMGARGKHRSGFEKIVGTRSTYVAKHVPCPVLIVPRDAKFAPITQLAYASDLSDADPHELSRALDLLKPAQPIVRCVHVSHHGDRSEDQKVEELKKELLAENPNTQIIFYNLLSNDTDQSLAEFSENFGVDILVLYHRHENIWQRLFRKSHTSELVSTSEIPLLVLKDQ